MNTIHIQLKKSYYIKIAVILFFAIVPGVVILNRAASSKLLFVGVFILFICLTPALLYFQRRQWVKILDDNGITRQDGKTFIWADLIEINEIYAHTQSGSKYFNHVELNFKNGKALVFPIVLENGGEILEALKKISKASE